jgi:hypothetical protein
MCDEEFYLMGCCCLLQFRYDNVIMLCGTVVWFLIGEMFGSDGDFTFYFNMKCISAR